MSRTVTTADRFRSRRVRAGLSIPELAKLASVAERTLRYIEAGEVAEPQMSTVRRVASALGIPVTDLVSEVRQCA